MSNLLVSIVGFLLVASLPFGYASAQTGGDSLEVQTGARVGGEIAPEAADSGAVHSPARPDYEALRPYTYRIEDPLFPSPRYDYADGWDVHEGVNVRVELSASAGFGSRAPKGVGLGRTVDFLYVSPVKNNWNYTLGLTSTGYHWGALQYNDVGVSGSVNYFHSDKVSLSLYGYKSLLSNSRNRFPAWEYGGWDYAGGGWGCAPWGGYGWLPYAPCHYGHLDSYLGGDLNVRFNNNTSLQVHLSAGRWE